MGQDAGDWTGAVGGPTLFAEALGATSSRASAGVESSFVHRFSIGNASFADFSPAAIRSEALSKPS